ncbi:MULTISPECIES: hypothetical protein [Bacillaceae]|uniref:hypothetical protein n=1 Tax=Bacillaceae TaxID=186817 RepID=UPI002FFE8284
MEKEYDSLHQTTSTSKAKENEQVLEISSTGYGLESVPIEDSVKFQPNQSENDRNPS